MKQRAHQVCAYVPRPSRRDRIVKAARWAIIAVIGVMLGLVLAGCTKRDQTDPTEVISGVGGLQLLTDHATGCQYLSKGYGVVEPRIAADGKSHMGCKEAAR